MIMVAEKTKKKHPGGRPTKYKPEYIAQVYKLCLLGATNEQIADFFEVNPDTVYQWKKVHKKFSESIKRGKMWADAQVAEALYKKATGFTKKVSKLFHYKGQVIEHEVEKYFPPDTAAAFIWLKNRQGWTDKQQVSVNERTNGDIITIEEIKERIAALDEAGDALVV